MRSANELAQVAALAHAGHNGSEIARATGIPRSTVSEWLRHARRPPVRPGCTACGAIHDFATLNAPYVYLLGLYLGDGCITRHARGVHRLRIFLDLRYPEIISLCAGAIREVLPANSVSVLPQFSNYVDRVGPSSVQVSAYSKAWPCLLPQHGPGRKHTRAIVLEPWQRDLVEREPAALLKGLIHSDGARFLNTCRGRQRPRYSFKNRSPDIRAIFCDACELVGVRWTTAGETVYVSRKADVARLDEFIGPKA